MQRLMSTRWPIFSIGQFFLAMAVGQWIGCAIESQMPAHMKAIIAVCGVIAIVIYAVVFIFLFNGSAYLKDGRVNPAYRISIAPISMHPSHFPASFTLSLFLLPVVMTATQYDHYLMRAGLMKSGDFPRWIIPCIAIFAFAAVFDFVYRWFANKRNNFPVSNASK